jgi:NifB/MoaA-like Fe-S oxidoreductase
VHIDLAVVNNHFYGESITISGLLTGQDIYQQLQGKVLGDLVLLPPRVLNHNGLFLDDWSIAELSEQLNTPCHVYSEDLSDFATVINRY